MKRSILSGILGLCLLISVDGKAGGFSGKYAFGERSWVFTGRSLGMGGLSVALPDAYNLSRWNPAQWSMLTQVSVNFLLLTDRTTPEGGTTASFIDFGGFAFGLPIGKNIAVGGGLYPVTNSKYDLVTEGVTEGESWTLSVRGFGGISGFAMGAGFKLGEDIRLGVKWDWLFGNKEEEWETRFSSSNIRTARTTKATSYDGSLLTLGILLNRSKFILGSSVSAAPSGSIERKLRIHYSYAEDLNLPKEKIDYPVEWRFGATYIPKDNVLAGVEVAFGDWSYLDDLYVGNYGKSFDISIGAELSGEPEADSFLRRFSKRIGFTFRRLYIKGLEEDAINERALTFGLGVPIGKRPGAILDAGLSIGSRGKAGTVAGKEGVILLAISYTAGEPWFVRRR